MFLRCVNAGIACRHILPLLHSEWCSLNPLGEVQGNILKIRVHLDGNAQCRTRCSALIDACRYLQKVVVFGNAAEQRRVRFRINRGCVEKFLIVCIDERDLCPFWQRAAGGMKHRAYVMQGREREDEIEPGDLLAGVDMDDLCIAEAEGVSALETQAG